MADEMGEEGGDDGFVDCIAGENVKRRNKKRGSEEEGDGEGGKERERVREGEMVKTCMYKPCSYSTLCV